MPVVQQDGQARPRGPGGLAHHQPPAPRRRPPVDAPDVVAGDVVAQAGERAAGGADERRRGALATNVGRRDGREGKVARMDEHPDGFVVRRTGRPHQPQRIGAGQDERARLHDTAPVRAQPVPDPAPHGAQPDRAPRPGRSGETLDRRGARPVQLKGDGDGLAGADPHRRDVPAHPRRGRTSGQDRRGDHGRERERAQRAGSRIAEAETAAAQHGTGRDQAPAAAGGTARDGHR